MGQIKTDGTDDWGGGLTRKQKRLKLIWEYTREGKDLALNNGMIADAKAKKIYTKKDREEAWDRSIREDFERDLREMRGKSGEPRFVPRVNNAHQYTLFEVGSAFDREGNTLRRGRQLMGHYGKAHASRLAQLVIDGDAPEMPEFKDGYRQIEASWDAREDALDCFDRRTAEDEEEGEEE